MARASTRTLLSLDRFASVIGLHPLHFNQVTVDGLAPATTCGQPIFQYAWQRAAAVGREELAEAIATAENNIALAVGYKLLPTWEASEQQVYHRNGPPEWHTNYGLNARGRNFGLRTNFGYVLSGGREAKTLISANASIVYSTDMFISEDQAVPRLLGQPNSIPYKETAIITVNTTVTNPDEIAVFYPDQSGDDAWEVRPIHVSISGGVATITVRREQLVRPQYMETISPSAVNGLDDENFLASVDVYRRYNDPSQQIQLLWENSPNSCGCGSTDCASCTFSTQMGCLLVRDTRLGLVSGSPGDWNAATAQFDVTSFSVGHQPNRAVLWYYAGWQAQNLRYPKIQMDRNWELAVARYAVTLLDRSICACQNVAALMDHWRNDMSMNLSSPSISTSFRIPQAKFNNPLGTTRGALFAWNIVNRQRLGEGTMV